MKIRTLIVAGSLVVPCVGVSLNVHAEEVAATATAVAATADEAAETVEVAASVVEQAGEELGQQADDAMGMSADGLAQWLAMIGPGEHHAKLEAYVGEWDVKTKFWMMPGMDPQESAGSSSIKWILDGRFIQENFQGSMAMPGMDPLPFKGFGLTGYDATKQQYVGIWSDTMSTGFMQSTGRFDDATGELKMSSTFDDPMTGQPTTMRMTLKKLDDNTHVMNGYSSLPDGGEYQCMEITYTRK